VAQSSSTVAPRRDVVTNEPSGQTDASAAAAAPAEGDTAEAEPGLLEGLKIVAKNGQAHRDERLSAGQPTVIFDTADSPPCSECGSIMVRNGSCYKCLNCGSTSGCS